MKERALQIIAPHFCAGIVFDSEEWVVIGTAPIVKYMKGWSAEAVKNYLFLKQWKWEWCGVAGMKVIIAGCRHITHMGPVEEAIRLSGFGISEVVCGKAPGVDTLGEDWAKANCIPVKEFPADWDTHKRSAGPIRNQQMADYADALIAVWDGRSKGTKDMIERMENIKPTYIHYVQLKSRRSVLKWPNLISGAKVGELLVNGQKPN